MFTLHPQPPFMVSRVQLLPQSRMASLAQTELWFIPVNRQQPQCVCRPHGTISARTLKTPRSWEGAVPVPVSCTPRAFLPRGFRGARALGCRGHAAPSHWPSAVYTQKGGGSLCLRMTGSWFVPGLSLAAEKGLQAACRHGGKGAGPGGGGPELARGSLLTERGSSLPVCEWTECGGWLFWWMSVSLNARPS